MSEEEFLTMLISAYVKRSDLQGASTYWSDPYYYFANEKNYPTMGWDNPEARRYKISRQQVAEIVAGAAGYNYSGEYAIRYLLANGLAKGKVPEESGGSGSVWAFKGADYLTRAEAVQFIKNAKENGLKELKIRPAQPSDTSQIGPIPSELPPVVIQPGSGTKVTVVPSTTPDLLLPKDAASEPAIQAFLDSLIFDKSTNTKIPSTFPSVSWRKT